tara:strand:- start:1249 stop:1887 length:639 start_codon:yes stop_codon:yes gene_type:complete
MKDSFFSKKNKRLITDPFDGQNPITVQVLGICSALAITVQLQQALIMALSVVVVMICGNMIVSLLRNVIPSRIRIIVQLVVVSALVVLVDLVLKAFLPDMSEKLSVFVGLIVSNCIIMGRLEAFALGNKLWPSFLDGLGNAIGYGWILLAVAFFREFLGSGKIFGYQIIGQSFFDAGYLNNNLMILPPMALIVVGLIIWVQRSRNRELIEEN